MTRPSRADRALLEPAARALLAHGYSIWDAARLLDIPYATLRRWLDPAFAAREREQYRAGTARRAFRPSGPLPPVPEDTRDLTGRLMGDPLPGRSALDRRRGIPAP